MLLAYLVHPPGLAMYVVLARKYRPKTLSALVGQPLVTQTLTNALVEGRVHHAYLFTGSRGVGKTSTARIMARSLNCVEGPTPNPCGTCYACQAITGGGGAESLLLQEIDGASHRDVESARQLRRTIGVRGQSRYRVVVIDEVHMLTREAFNTLLKTLEEPPPHVKFIFATTEVHKVPETILSRCQRLDFHRVPVPAMAAEVERIAALEGVALGAGVADLLARSAEGGMRDCISHLDQAISFCGTTINVEDVSRIFGILPRRLMGNLISACRVGAYDRVVKAAAYIYQEGLDVSRVLGDLATAYRDALVMRNCGPATDLVEMAPADRDALLEAVGDMSLPTLMYAIEVLTHTQERLRTTPFPRMVLELALVKLCQLEEMESIPSLLEQLQQHQV